MAPRAVDRNTDELGAELLELWKHFVVKGHLVTADWAPIRRIKGKHDWLATKFAQREPLVWRAAQFEIRSRRASLESRTATVRMHILAGVFLGRHV